MSKEELKVLYRTGRLTTKEYFYRLCRIIKSEMPITVKQSEPDVLEIFDGELPLFIRKM